MSHPLTAMEIAMTKAERRKARLETEATQREQVYRDSCNTIAASLGLAYSADFYVCKNAGTGIWMLCQGSSVVAEKALPAAIDHIHAAQLWALES